MPTSSDTSTLAAFGQFALSLVLGALGFISRGWAVSTIWNWFVATSFNAPRLGIVSAIGLSIAVSILTTNLSQSIKEVNADKRETSEKLLESFLISVIAYPVWVGFAWVVHSLL